MNRTFSLVLLVGGYFDNVIGNQKVPINEILVVLVSHTTNKMCTHSFSKVMMNYTRVSPLMTTIADTNKKFVMILGGLNLKNFTIASSFQQAEYISIPELFQKSIQQFNQNLPIDFKKKMQVKVLSLNVRVPFPESQLNYCVMSSMQLEGQKVKVAFSQKNTWICKPPDWGTQSISIVATSLPRVFENGLVCNQMGRVLVNTLYYF